MLIDCGEGTQLLMRKHQVKISKINIIVISHLHGDHYYGLIGLLSTLHLFGRRKDLTLIGPPGLLEVLSLQLKYSETTLNFKINFTEWVPGTVSLVFDHTKFTITTIPLEHRVPCAGYLFQEKPKKRRIDKLKLPDKLPPADIYKLKCGEDLTDDEGNVLHKNADVTLAPLRSLSYAFCSDTRYKPELVENIKGVDLLYHEATFTSEMERRAKDTFHSTARQAATIARDAEVGKLLIGHFSTRYRNLEPVLDEAPEVFEQTSLAEEGHIFEIDDQ